jgi:hypothetical protein
VQLTREKERETVIGQLEASLSSCLRVIAAT